MVVTPRPQTLARIALVALVALPLGLRAAPYVPGAALSRGVEEANERNARVLDKFAGAQVLQVNKLGGRSAKVLEMVTAKRRFILRQPRRGVAHAMRVALAQQKLAANLGDARIIPPQASARAEATLARFIPTGTEIMVVKHVGEQYQDASVAPPQWIAKIPEHKKLIAAIVDLFAEQRDRKTANVMVREDGTIRLIDPDKTFGEGHVGTDGKPNLAFRSQFFPGGLLQYTSPQNKFTDLPEEMQHLITDLAAMHDAPTGVNQAAQHYGLLPAEAQLMLKHAKRVTQVGLTATINEYVASLGQLRPDR
jgi:hypothetical protein